MRNNSPTGGALGNVAAQELELLKNVRASINQTQSPEQLKNNLLKTKQDYSAMRQRITEAFNKDFGDVSSPKPDAGRRLKFNPQTGEIE